MNAASWRQTSIMAKRGLAKGSAGRRHDLDIAGQGAFQYVHGRYAEPKRTTDPGDFAVVETEDAFDGVITSEHDSPTANGRPEMHHGRVGLEERSLGLKGWQLQPGGWHNECQS
jgi:hypothetical protein